MTQQEKKAPSITIDGVEYQYDSLTEQAKGLINSLQVAGREITRLEQQLGLARIAQQAIGHSLKANVTAPAADATKAA